VPNKSHARPPRGKGVGLCHGTGGVRKKQHEAWCKKKNFLSRTRDAQEKGGLEQGVRDEGVKLKQGRQGNGPKTDPFLQKKRGKAPATEEGNQGETNSNKNGKEDAAALKVKKKKGQQKTDPQNGEKTHSYRQRTKPIHKGTGTEKAANKKNAKKKYKGEW